MGAFQSSLPQLQSDAIADTVRHPHTAQYLDSQRILQSVHIDFARPLEALLQQILGIPVTVQTTLQLCPASTYHRLYGAPGWRISLLLAQQAVGSCELSPQLALHLVARQFGAVIDLSAPRSLSEVEAHMLRPALAPLLSAYADAWSPYLPIQAQASADAGYGEDESLYLAAFDIRGADMHGAIYFLLRLTALDAPLRQVPPLEASQTPATVNTGMVHTLGGCAVPFRVMLGRTHMTLRELLGLRVGDILCLEKDPASPVEVLIGKRAHLQGTVHVEDDRFMVTIQDTTPKERSHES